MPAGPLSPEGRQKMLGILLAAVIVIGTLSAWRAVQVAREAAGISTYERVRGVLARRMSMQKASISPNASLDGVDKRELVAALGEEFELNLSENEAEALATVQDAVNLVERSLARSRRRSDD